MFPSLRAIIGFFVRPMFTIYCATPKKLNSVKWDTISRSSTIFILASIQSWKILFNNKFLFFSFSGCIQFGLFSSLRSCKLGFILFCGFQWTFFGWLFCKIAVTVVCEFFQQLPGFPEIRLIHTLFCTTICLIRGFSRLCYSWNIKFNLFKSL